MKFNRPLTIAAIIYLVINTLFILNAATLNGGGSMIYIFIFPFFWIVTLVIITTLSIKNRKIWFKKDMLLSTLLAIFFCTPVSVSLFVLISRPASYLSSSGSNQKDGHQINSEEWNYYSNESRAINKYWKDGKKDSTWVYFNKNGDTLATETYSEDKLIHKRSFK
jgi:hypothetical protein